MAETPNFGLSDDWLKLMAALIVQWSAFEWTLTFHIRLFLHQPRAADLRPKHLHLPVNRRLALYDKLAPLFFSDSAALEAAKMATKMARAVKDDRNALAHGMGIQGQGDDLVVYSISEASDRTAREIITPFTREQIVVAARAMEKARLLLVRAYSSVMDELEPSP
jgi:hypothetical protein